MRGRKHGERREQRGSTGRGREQGEEESKVRGLEQG